MRKAFALISIFLMALCACSCAAGSVDKRVGYTPLYVDVILYVTESGEGAKAYYEVQIGALESALTDLSPDRALTEAERALGRKFYYEGYHYGTNDSEDYPYSSESMIYLCYTTPKATLDIKAGEAKYGFFYAKRDYTITNPFDISGLSQVLQLQFAQIFSARGYQIDTEEFRTRYYYAIGSDMDSDNASVVSKTIVSLSQSNVKCLMWDENDDISTITYTYKIMTAGWYIIPILLGAVVVTIILVLTKNKKRAAVDTVFRVDDHPQDIANNQISIEEWQNDLYESEIYPQSNGSDKQPPNEENEKNHTIEAQQNERPAGETSLKSDAPTKEEIRLKSENSDNLGE